MQITRKELREQWIKALRSGEYKQGKGQLQTLQTDYVTKQDVYAFCCLGVLTDQIRQMCEDEEAKAELVNNLTFSAYLSNKVAEMVGMSTSHDGPSPQGELAEMNDDGSKTFHDIADTLETQPQLWFDPEADPDEIVSC